MKMKKIVWFRIEANKFDESAPILTVEGFTNLLMKVDEEIFIDFFYIP
jgi:hypothetical protein